MERLRRQRSSGENRTRPDNRRSHWRPQRAARAGSRQQLVPAVHQPLDRRPRVRLRRRAAGQRRRGCELDDHRLRAVLQPLRRSSQRRRLVACPGRAHAGTAGDPTDYSGSLIRVNPDTGAAMPNNPFSENPARNSKGEEDVAARRILAYGFRNPYRFTVEPGTGEVYIGNVGQLPVGGGRPSQITTGPRSAGARIGWPCYEGGSGGVAANTARLGRAWNAPLRSAL